MLENNENEIALNESADSEWCAEWEKFECKFPAIFDEKNRRLSWMSCLWSRILKKCF